MTFFRLFFLFMNNLFYISEGILFDIITEVDWDMYWTIGKHTK